MFEGLKNRGFNSGLVRLIAITPSILSFDDFCFNSGLVRLIVILMMVGLMLIMGFNSGLVRLIATGPLRFSKVSTMFQFRFGAIDRLLH